MSSRARKNGKVRLDIAEEKELLGSAGTLAENMAFVEGEKEFYILYGDVLTNVNLLGLIKCHREKRQVVTLGIHQVPDPTQCGIVSADENGIVQSFVEKPAKPDGNWAFSGVMVASQEIFSIYAETKAGGHRLSSAATAGREDGRIQDFRVPAGHWYTQ